MNETWDGLLLLLFLLPPSEVGGGQATYLFQESKDFIRTCSTDCSIAPAPAPRLVSNKISNFKLSSVILFSSVLTQGTDGGRYLTEFSVFINR